LGPLERASPKEEDDLKTRVIVIQHSFFRCLQFVFEMFLIRRDKLWSVTQLFEAHCYKPEGCGFCSNYLKVPAALGPGVYSACIRNEYRTKMFLESRARQARKDDNLNAICQPTV
jgi:hypothetical protein